MKGSIFLIGFMASGKSTVAKALSARTGLPLIEMDEEIERRAGMTISAIFEKSGEGAFRAMERDLLKEIATRDGSIVSCGGGLVKNENNVTIMKTAGTIVLLTAAPETILFRVKKNDARPLLRGKKDLLSIAAMMEERRPMYESAADIVVPVDGKSPDEIASAIIVDLLAEN